MASLPSHRQFLTRLLNAISDIAPQPADSAPASPPSAPPRTATGAAVPLSSTSSPLQGIPEAQRPLLLTLHVLFPDLLLPALDLLDRRLVVRLCRQETHVPHGDGDEGGGRGDEAGDSSPAIAGCSDAIFLVRSTAATMTRRGRDHALSSQRYIVHLDAWNCSCAGFTFDAFPSQVGSIVGQNEASEPRQPEPKWSFGGLSSSGTSASGVPCCKHLLASLLVEKWPDVMGRYVEKRAVTRDEMAGIVAEM